MMLKISVSVLLLQYSSLGRVFIDYRCSVLAPNDIFQTDTALGRLSLSFALHLVGFIAFPLETKNCTSHWTILASTISHFLLCGVCVCMCTCVLCVCVSASICMEVRGQPRLLAFTFHHLWN